MLAPRSHPSSAASKGCVCGHRLVGGRVRGTYCSVIPAHLAASPPAAPNPLAHGGCWCWWEPEQVFRVVHGGGGVCGGVLQRLPLPWR